MTSLKDLKQHKFPMDEIEQALLLDEISRFEKELREIVNACETQVIQGENVRIHLQARAEAFKEILGDSE